MTETLSFAAVYLSGVFSGICLLVLLLSLLIGYAYTERMLWWHAATLSTALLAHALQDIDHSLSAAFWAMELALAAMSLRAMAGTSGATRRPAVALGLLAVAYTALAVLRLLPVSLTGWLLLPWAAAAGWHLFRGWTQSRPWVYWMALGQVALGLHGLFRTPLVPAMLDIAPQVESMAALSVFAFSTYLAMVWFSRLRSENALRVEARERTDPLTGLAMPRVFFDRADGALIRSRNMAYGCAFLVIRVNNMDQVVAEQKLESSEAAILAASRAIASSLRAHDSAARLGNNRFAVMAEGISPGGAAELATRILARGLRAGEWGLTGSELQFQISVVEISQAPTEARAILRQLDDALTWLTAQDTSQKILTLPRIG